MADPVLKFPGEQAPPAADAKRKPLSGRLNKTRRLILLVIIPLVAGIAGLAVYLSGGRYMTTDNAYVGAQKVLVTPDISGKTSKVVVREGQRVQVGDVLFEIDAEPFRLALQQAEARVASARTDHANLLTNDKAMSRMIELAQKTADVEAPGRRTQIDADGQPQRFAVRPRFVQCPARRRADAGRAIEPAAGRHPQPAARQSGPAARPIPAVPAGQGGTRPGAARPQPHDGARAARRQRDAGRQHPARPLRQRRHAGAERDRRRQSVGGRQSEGNRFHLRRARTEGDDRRRRIPEPHLQGPHHLDEPRHRRAIRDPAAAERQRQLGEGGAARADPHLVRSRTRTREGCAPA